MKIKSIMLTVIMLVSFAGLSAQTKKDSNNVVVTFNVPSMDCVSCKNKIEKNIAFEKGVKALDVDLENKTVKIGYDKRKIDNEKLLSSFKKIGYPATVAPCCATKEQAK